MKKLTLILFSLFLFSILSAQVDDKKASAILEEVSKKAKSYSAIKIEFTYVMENKDENIHETLDGILYSKGDKYRLHFMEQIVISDGKTNWVYNSDAEEVQITTVDPNDEQSNPTSLLTSYDKSYRSKLIKEKAENGVFLQTIDLVPLKGKSYYKIRLKIDKAKKQIVEVIIYEKNNTIFTYIVKAFTPNVNINDSKFKFDKASYPGVEVIDLR
ncbi:MAG: outer membrane lipoprotein carrier protein LolA [Saprospiraceae bacterium]|nr:outer membrane lipoprotein carrier protein LolA [Saprospiraceae bacterium]